MHEREYNWADCHGRSARWGVSKGLCCIGVDAFAVRCDFPNIPGMQWMDGHNEAAPFKSEIAPSVRCNTEVLSLFTCCRLLDERAHAQCLQHSWLTAVQTLPSK